MADIAVVSLELSTDKLAQQSRLVSDTLKRIEDASDRVSTAQRKTQGSVSSTEREMAKAARENAAYAQAMSRLQRATGDYDGAIRTLEIHLKSLTSTSSAYVRVQAQIAQIQAQQGRAQRGENFAGFAASFKNIESQLQGIGGTFGAIPTRIGNATSALGQFLGMSNQGLAVVGGLTLGVTALGVGAALAAKQIFDLSVEGAKLADELNDASRITGISVGQLSLIKTAAAQGGSSLAEFQQSAQLFGSKLEEVSQGKLPRLAGALKAFGIDAKKGIEEPEQAVIAFGKALATVEDPVLRLSLAREGLGRNGAKLIPLFDALNATTATSGRITDDVARAAGALDDKLAGVRDRADDAKIQIAAMTAPSITQGIDAMALAFEALAGGLNSVAESRGLKVLPLLSLFFAQVRPGAVGDALIAGGASKSPSIQGPGGAPSRASLLNSTPISDLVRAAQNREGAGTRSSRTAGSPAFAFDELAPRVAEQIRVMADAARYAGQELPNLQDGLQSVRTELQTTRQTLDILSKGGATGTKEYAEAFKKFNELLRQQAQLLGVINGRVPRVGDFPSVDTRGRLVIGGAPPIASGGIPGQFDPGNAPDPRGFRLTGLRQEFFGRTTGTGERIRGVGEQIAQDFITGALLGQADARRAGEQIAFFFADYFAQKLSETLTKALDPVFDAIGDLFVGLFKSIGSKLLGGIGGALGGGFGGLFRAGGGPVTAGVGYTVGESGREWFVPQQNGFIVNQQQAAAAVSGGGGGGMVVNMYFNIAAPEGRVERRSLDQISENATYALARAQRNRGA